MIKPLSTKKEFFISSEAEALDFVDDCRDGKDGELIVAQQVQHKSNKNGDYWRVVLEYRYNTPAGIQESQAEDAADEDEIEDTVDTEEE